MGKGISHKDKNGDPVLTAKDPGKNVASETIVKLWSHYDRQGSIRFINDNVNGGYSYDTLFDAWGSIQKESSLKLGSRTLSFAEYATYGYDHCTTPAQVRLGVVIRLTVVVIVYSILTMRWLKKLKIKKTDDESQ